MDTRADFSYCSQPVKVWWLPPSLLAKAKPGSLLGRRVSSYCGNLVGVQDTCSP